MRDEIADYSLADQNKDRRFLFVKNKILVISVALLLAITLVAVGCAKPAPAPAPAPVPAPKPEVIYITVGTASMGGTFYPFGTGIAKIITEYAEGVEATAEVTAGSVDNTGLVGSGKTDVALAMADVVYGGYTATGKFEGKAEFKDLRGLFMAYGQMMHVLVKEDSPIKSIADLKGKKMSPGPAGSGTECMTGIILEAFGLSWDDVKAEYLTHTEQSMSLADGTIAAAWYLMGVPCAAVTEFCTSHAARFIPLEKEYIKKITDEYPFYAEMPVPAGTYPGQPNAIPSIGVKVCFIANKNVPEDVAYEITKAVLEHLPELEQIHSIAKEVSFEGALVGMPIPLHPGAERYYKEKGHPGL